LAEVLLAGEIKGRPAVRLGAVAQVALVTAPFAIERVDGSYAARIDVESKHATSRDALAKLASSSLEVTPDYRWRWWSDPDPWRIDAAWRWAASAVVTALMAGFALFFVRPPRNVVAMVFTGSAAALAVLGAALAFGTAEISSAWLGGVLAVCLGGLAVGASSATRRTLMARRAFTIERSTLRFFTAVSVGVLPFALGWAGGGQPVRELAMFFEIGVGATIAVALWLVTHPSDVEKVRE
jgi:hypothetical protein